MTQTVTEVTVSNELANTELRVFYDGVLDKTKRTPNNTLLNITDGQYAMVCVGIEIHPVVTQMPISFALPKGLSFGEKVRLVKTMIRVHNTQGLIVNGRTLPLFTDADGSEANLTGIVEEFLRGWSKEAQVTVSQTEPYPFTILSINTQFEV